MKNTKSKAQKTYEYLRAKLLREAKRGGLTAQEDKLFKLVDIQPSKLNFKEIRERANKVKAEFKRIRKTKKYKAERKLRNEFYKELKDYEDYELRREARRRLQNLPPDADQLQSAYFKITTYKRLLEEGLTRRVNNKIVRIKGVEAVKTQIASLKQANNPDYKKQAFINTYIEQLQLNGVPDEYTSNENGEEITRQPIKEIAEYLQSLDPKKITFLLDTGLLNDISFYYLWTDSDTEAFINRLDYLINNKNKIQEQYETAYANEGEIIKIIKRERKLKDKTIKQVHKNY